MGFASGTVCTTAVCIPAESKLLLEGIGDGAQKELGVGAVEEVAMTRVEGGLYKDAVRFSNGTVALLQRLNIGLSAVVMTFGAERAEAARAPAREPELV
jgi:hypothetical protein